MVWIILAVIVVIILGASYGLFRFVMYYDEDNAPENVNPDKGSYEDYEAIRDRMKDELDTLAWERVWIASQDMLNLSGRYLHVRDGAPVVLMCHGFRSGASREFYGSAPVFIGLGCNILMIDERACGESESKVITFGVKERYDCINWINYILERFGDDTKIILVGVSMGAATVLSASNLDIDKNVAGIVADCGFTDPMEIIMITGQKLGLPPKLCKPFMKIGAFIFGHVRLGESSAIESVKQTAIPALIIHGSADTFVPTEMGYRINEAYAGPHSFELFEGATHAMSYLSDPERYKELLKKFYYSLNLQ